MNLNNLNFSLMFIYASFAAVTTCYFAFSVGVKPVHTIFMRAIISFALFAVVGFFLGNYLKDEIEKTLAQNAEKEAKEEAEKPVEELPPLVLEGQENSEQQGFEEQSSDDNINNLQNQPNNNETGQESMLQNSVDEGSFDKVVVVNNDTD